MPEKICVCAFQEVVIDVLTEIVDEARVEEVEGGNKNISASCYLLSSAFKFNVVSEFLDQTKLWSNKRTWGLINEKIKT